MSTLCKLDDPTAYVCQFQDSVVSTIVYPIYQAMFWYVLLWKLLLLEVCLIIWRYTLVISLSEPNIIEFLSIHISIEEVKRTVEPLEAKHPSGGIYF